MIPKAHFRQPVEDEYLQRLIKVIEGIDCAYYFSDHLGSGQSEQRGIVNRFQHDLLARLQAHISETKWEAEHIPHVNQRDSIDIYGENEDNVVAIELDKHRADQVAKKFVSRLAILPERKVYFVSLCYPGTANMNKRECIKYFGYCANLCKRMGNAYVGFTLESKT